MLTEYLFTGYVLTCTSSVLAGLDAGVRGVRLDAPPPMPAQLVDLVVVARDPGQQPVGRAGLRVLDLNGFDCAAAVTATPTHMAAVRRTTRGGLST